MPLSATWPTTLSVEQERLVNDNLDLTRGIACKQALLRGVPLDDAKQEAWLALRRAAIRWNPLAGPFKPFANMAVTNSIIDMYRREQRCFWLNRRDGEVSGRNYGPDDNLDRVEDDSNLERVEDRDYLRYLAGSLEWPMRLVVRLIYDEGLTQAEVGRVLGKTRMAINQVHTSAINRLRRMAGDEAAKE